MLVSKIEARTGVRRTIGVVSLAIATLSYQHGVYAEEGDPAKAAFGNSAGFTIPAGSPTFFAALMQVPVGKRYVIELVSLACTAPVGTFVSSAVLEVAQNVPSFGNPFSTQGFHIALQSQGTDQAGIQYFVGNLVARMYADDVFRSPNDVFLIVNQSNTASATNCSVSFSGYLVSL
jgi:hypothetical protein